MTFKILNLFFFLNDPDFRVTKIEWQLIYHIIFNDINKLYILYRVQENIISTTKMRNIFLVHYQIVNFSNKAIGIFDFCLLLLIVTPLLLKAKVIKTFRYRLSYKERPKIIERSIKKMKQRTETKNKDDQVW